MRKILISYLEQVSDRDVDYGFYTNSYSDSSGKVWLLAEIIDERDPTQEKSPTKFSLSYLAQSSATSKVVDFVAFSEDHISERDEDKIYSINVMGFVVTDRAVVFLVQNFSKSRGEAAVWSAPIYELVKLDFSTLNRVSCGINLGDYGANNPILLAAHGGQIFLAPVSSNSLEVYDDLKLEPVEKYPIGAISAYKRMGQDIFTVSTVIPYQINKFSLSTHVFYPEMIIQFAENVEWQSILPGWGGFILVGLSPASEGPGTNLVVLSAKSASSELILQRELARLFSAVRERDAEQALPDPPDLAYRIDFHGIVSNEEIVICVTEIRPEDGTHFETQLYIILSHSGTIRASKVGEFDTDFISVEQISNEKWIALFNGALYEVSFPAP